MKKRRAPLFADQEPATYVMDSSAWFDIDTLSNVREAWAVVIALITAGRLFAPVEVLDELRSDDDLWPRIQPYEGKLRGGARNDETYLLLAGRIAHAYPSLAGLRSRKTKADPFVIALAELESYIVVTDESTKRPSRKIPGVCDKRQVKWTTLVSMVAVEQTSLSNS